MKGSSGCARISRRQLFPGGNVRNANEIRGIILGNPKQDIEGFKDVGIVSTRSGRTDGGLDPFPPSRMEMMIARSRAITGRSFEPRGTSRGDRPKLRERFPTCASTSLSRSSTT